MSRHNFERRTRRVTALVSDPVYRLVHRAADEAEMSVAAVVRSGAIRAAREIVDREDSNE